MIAEVVGSYWLALIFQASHVISEVGSKIITKPLSDSLTRTHLDRGKVAHMDFSCYNFYIPAIIPQSPRLLEIDEINQHRREIKLAPEKLKGLCHLFYLLF